MGDADGAPDRPERASQVLERGASDGNVTGDRVRSSDRRAEQELLAALRAAQHGDFTVRLPTRWPGAMGEIAEAFNGLMERNTAVSSELDRVGRTVGREGRMDERFDMGPVGGAWSSQARAINRLIDDLMRPTNEVARVIMAVADGDLSQKMALEIDGKPVKGEFARIGEAVNAMVDELSAFAAEVSRVAREVGTDGKLGGQARVDGVSGIWRDLTDNVNSMASNLTNQVRNISQVATAVADGDLSQKITVEAKGEVAALADTINSMTDTLRTFADEVTRVAREVGTEGKLGGQAEVPGVAGIWKDLTDNVNSMASNLTDQVRNIAHVSTAVANGDLSQKITVDVKGEILELKDTINTMVDQLSSFADEVTRVAREVGTEGKLGGQAQVEGVSGIWEDLTDNVNSMASNLTSQVRNIAHVSTAVADGDLSQKITVEAKGEVAALADTINSMTDTLRTFADEATRVAREVGTEGKLGGQAEVPGVAGIWKDLTDNVNQLAANLTTQVRAIAEVATAVAQGDLTRAIAVDAQGEVADLKDNINQMIDNLKETTRKNAEQDWLKTNLARISQMMQGQRDLEELSRLIMSELTPTISAQHGAFFLADNGEDGDRTLRLIASYGYTSRKGVPNRFRFGEGLVGQAAVERAPIHIVEAPPDYIQIGSGLGEAPPANIILLPVLFEEQVLGVIELASFEPFTDVDRTFLAQVIETIGVVLNTIKATMQTEELLQRSQRLTEELQRRQDDLQSANVELQEKARLLAEQNRNIEIKNREIELARRGLEEKAEQLALSSRYKSEFLANVSHELRTPLNSLLILSDLLHDNEEDNLTEEQLEFVTSIADAGRDLLRLINDILDLSKVESGKMEVSPADVEVRSVVDFVEQTFQPIAAQQGLDFRVRVDPDVPDQLRTDEQRLQQILRNLLSNAFKFTEVGTVELEVGTASPETAFRSPALRATRPVLCFAVEDSGIGIPEHQLEHIFEAFHQADGTTNRRFGGTGLGLSISREIAQLLGGEIQVDSQVGEGSTFALYLAARPSWEPGETRQPSPDEGGPVAVTHTPRTGRVVTVSEDQTRSAEIERLLQLAGAAEVVTAGATIEAIDALHEHPADLLVADLEPTGTIAFNVLRELIEEPELRTVPVLAYRQRRLLRVETAHLQACASTLLIERLETADQLVRAARAHLEIDREEGEEGEEESGVTTDDPALEEDPLVGARLLLADDDERNVFALRRALERYGMEVLTVTDGRQALATLESDPDIDLVLMDLMMPEMDGYEAMRSIRNQPRLERLPVIALTAKAMRGDRELSLAAGASDYLPKPVDVDELVTTLRRWLDRTPGDGSLTRT